MTMPFRLVRFLRASRSGVVRLSAIFKGHITLAHNISGDSPYFRCPDEERFYPIEILALIELVRHIFRKSEDMQNWRGTS